MSRSRGYKTFLFSTLLIMKFRLLIKILNNFIEEIYFFEVNTKYISSSVLKASEFSRVHSTSENSDVFNSRDEIYSVFTSKK